MPVKGHRCCGERGDTLIEILFAVVIISICVAALMGALITAISSSGEHRGLAVDETLLKSYAEASKQQIEVSQTVAFVPCTTSYAISYSPPSQFSQYTVVQKSVAWWNTSTKSFSTTTCNNVKPDKGIQLITVTASAPASIGGYSQTLAFVVRDPKYES